MKNKLFYFSGTGNSLKVARDLADALGDAEIIPIPNVMAKDNMIIDSESIGIIFPVYMFGMPLIVHEFIKKLKCNKDQYIFSVSTCLPGFPSLCQVIILRYMVPLVLRNSKRCLIKKRLGL
ncbi:MAG: flavodoxin family protein [Candidatus Omnitrophica bacterium]|nr:flavodoxin family protein [Candidatus Omnitrophota bacterium]